MSKAVNLENVHNTKLLHKVTEFTHVYAMGGVIFSVCPQEGVIFNPSHRQKMAAVFRLIPSDLLLRDCRRF